MSKALDLVGQKFGYLTVIKRIENDKRGGTMWLCRCDCGEYATIRGPSLVNGHSKSCGCFNGLSTKEYLLSKINITDKDKWLWNGCLNKDGYGRAYYKGREVKAHRLSYIVFKGKIKEGLIVCHKNDCPQDINPDNLFLGTFKENTQDMLNKGRHIKGRHIPKPQFFGEGNPNSKLTQERVDIIRKEYDPKKRNGKLLAQRFGVHNSQIYSIVNNKTWTHVKDTPTS